MPSEQAHRLARRGAHRHEPGALDQGFDDGVRRFVRPENAGRHTERPGRSGHQQRARPHLMAGEIAGPQLVLDQPVGSGIVRHPQQRLREHHQRQTLPGRQANTRAGNPRFRRRRRPRTDRSTRRRASASTRASAAGSPRRLGEKACRDVLVGGRVGGPERPERGRSRGDGHSGSTVMRASAATRDAAILHADGRACALRAAWRAPRPLPEYAAISAACGKSEAANCVGLRFRSVCSFLTEAPDRPGFAYWCGGSEVRIRRCSEGLRTSESGHQRMIRRCGNGSSRRSCANSIFWSAIGRKTGIHFC